MDFSQPQKNVTSVNQNAHNQSPTPHLTAHLLNEVPCNVMFLFLYATQTAAKDWLNGPQGSIHDPDSPWCLGQCFNAGEKKCVATGARIASSVHECMQETTRCCMTRDVSACVTFPWAQCMGHPPKEDDGLPPQGVDVAPSVSLSGFDGGPEVSWDDDEGEIDWGE